MMKNKQDRYESESTINQEDASSGVELGKPNVMDVL